MAAPLALVQLTTTPRSTRSHQLQPRTQRLAVRAQAVEQPVVQHVAGGLQDGQVPSAAVHIIQPVSQ